MSLKSPAVQRRIYAGLYLGMVFLLPCYYVRVPDGFYHTTAPLEASVTDDGEALYGEIRWMVETHFESCGLSNARIGSWILKTEGLGIDSLRITQVRTAEGDGLLNTRIMFRSTCIIARIGHEQDWSYNEEVLFHITMETFPYGDVAIAQWTVKADDMERLHDVADAIGKLSSNTKIEPRFADAAYRYALASNGLSGYSTKNYQRMLYFSIMTATTVGYGDIIPIRDDSRAAAGCEALMGVVLVGLFLNTLTMKDQR